LCWWLNDLDRLNESELESTVLVQRYFLALLYYTTGGPSWLNNRNWMSILPECEWYGVSCDSYNRIISKIDLSINNLVGSIPSELGEIRGLEHLILRGNILEGIMPIEIFKLELLKTLDLSQNRINGTIPEEIKFLKNLEELNLSSNRMTSTIPIEISLVKDLRKVNLGKNSLAGKVPQEICELDKLKFISVERNLMVGELGMLSDLFELEYLDFSYNYFGGSLPLFGERQKKLRTAILNNNQFSGGIPNNIDQLAGLEELLAFGNLLTGSLPSQLGRLHNISKVSFAYNQLRGTISSELSNLKNLTMLQLHSNGLNGYSDIFDYTIESFITDCGGTETSRALVKCSSCSECCNVEGSCISLAKTWPQGVKKLGVDSAPLICYFAFGVSLVLCCCCLFFSVFSKRLPKLPYFIWQEFQQESAYRWFLSSSKMAWLLASLSVAFQISIIIIILQAGDFSSQGNLWLYSMNCPVDDTFCTEEKKTDIVGWFAFSVIIAVILLQDFVPGVLMFYESSINFSLKGIFAAMALLNITVLSAVASSVFIYATSISNIAIIIDAVVVLFLNSFDEQIFTLIRLAAPAWTDKIESGIMNETLSKLIHEISEVAEDEGNLDDNDLSALNQLGNNAYSEGGDSEVTIINNAVDARIEKVKQDLIFEIMAIYNADKAKFMNTCETEKSQILNELKEVKEENSKIREENSRMKEENSKMKEENSRMKEENSKMKEENSKMKAILEARMLLIP